MIQLAVVQHNKISKRNARLSLGFFLIAFLTIFVNPIQLAAFLVVGFGFLFLYFGLKPNPVKADFELNDLIEEVNDNVFIEAKNSYRVLKFDAKTRKTLIQNIQTLEFKEIYFNKLSNYRKC